MANPLCFVLMPFGVKPELGGALIDFDTICRELIGPAVTAADLEPLRADEERADGIIHKPMYERLILCEYAVADLTTANANVFCELGLCHAVRPATTLLELAVARDEEDAVVVLGDAVAAVRERWEAETTSGNLRIIREARARRGDGVAWALGFEEELAKRAG